MKIKIKKRRSNKVNKNSTKTRETMSCSENTSKGIMDKESACKHKIPTVHKYYNASKPRRNRNNPNEFKSIKVLNTTLDRLTDVISSFSLDKDKKIYREISTQTDEEHEPESKLSHTTEYNNLYLMRLITNLLQIGNNNCNCNCGRETIIKGSMATRLYCSNNYPQYSNGYLSFVDEMGNPRADIDINTCMSSFHRMMNFISRNSNNIRMLNKSSFMGDSDMIRRNGIKSIYTYEFTMNANNESNTYMGLRKDIKIIIDFCIVLTNKATSFLTHSHRIFKCGFNTFGIMPINFINVTKYTMRGLIEYSKMIIHENKMENSGLTIKEYDELPLGIVSDINTGFYNSIRDKLFRDKISYKLVSFSSEYKNLSIETSKLNCDEFMAQLYMRWIRKTRIWGNIDKISCPKDKEAWISFVREQLNDDDIYTSEPLNKSKRIVLRPCGHMSDHVGYLNELVMYLIYRMNRLEGQPPSYEEGGTCLQSNNKCPFCRYESFQIGTIRDEFRCQCKIFGRDISLSSIRSDFIHPIS